MPSGEKRGLPTRPAGRRSAGSARRRSTRRRAPAACPRGSARRNATHRPSGRRRPARCRGARGSARRGAAVTRRASTDPEVADVLVVGQVGADDRHDGARAVGQDGRGAGDMQELESVGSTRRTYVRARRHASRQALTVVLGGRRRLAGARRRRLEPVLRVALGAQHGDRRLEVLERVERLVDAGEPQVGDLVELAQRAEDREPDLVRVDLRRARAAAASPRPSARAARGRPRSPAGPGTPCARRRRSSRG